MKNHVYKERKGHNTCETRVKKHTSYLYRKKHYNAWVKRSQDHGT